MLERLEEEEDEVERAARVPVAGGAGGEEEAWSVCPLSSRRVPSIHEQGLRDFGLEVLVRQRDDGGGGGGERVERSPK